MFTSVRTPRVYQHIVGQIERAIFDGRLASGDRLPPERELVRQFGASRVAVREALHTLEHRGLIEVRHGSSGGHFVRPLDTGLVRRDLTTLLRMSRLTVWQIAEARLLLEPQVARLAAQRAGDLDVKALVAALERPEGTGAEDPHALELAFHRQVAAAAKNPVHTLLVDTLLDLETEMEVAGGEVPQPDTVAREHGAIASAIAAGDVEGAHAAMEAHLLEEQRRLRRRDLARRAAAERVGEAP